MDHLLKSGEEYGLFSLKNRILKYLKGLDIQ